MDSEAAGEVVDDSWAYDVWHDTMSPYCPGRTLAECPSPQADQLRLWILDQAASGVSRDEVQQVLLQQFGDDILTAPRAEGWGLAAYGIPLAGFVLGAVVVALVMRRMVGPRRESPPDTRPIDPDLKRRIDEELGP